MNGKNALIVTLSHVPADGRALRFAEVFAGMGYKVHTAGLQRYRISPPTNPHDNITRVEVRPFQGPRLLRRWWLAGSLAASRLIPALRRNAYWAMPERILLLQAIRRHARRNALCFDIVVAKHWSAGPIAQAIAREHGARLLYDANELGFAEHEDNRMWRVLAAPHVRAVESRLVDESDAITTIGEMIADEYAKEYRLTAKPVAVRNIINTPEPAFRPPGSPLAFVYVGLAVPGRNLETIIKSVPQWLPDRRLFLHLTGEPAFIDALRDLACQAASPDRVTFRDPVSIEELPETLSQYDVGLIPFGGTSRQKRFAEPNKLYQYISAGLAVASAPLDQIRTHVDRYGFGACWNEGGANELTRFINAMTPDQIASMKQMAVKANQTFNWSSESAKLKTVIRMLGN